MTSGIPQGLDRGNITIDAMKRVGQDEAMEISAEQRTSLDAFKNEQSETTNPLTLVKKQESLKDRILVTKKEQAKEAGETIPIEEVQKKADEFEQNHPEHKAGDLVVLRQNVKSTDKKEDILKKVKEYTSDPTLINEALQFLLSSSGGDLKLEINQAIQEFQAQNKQEITAGINISGPVKEGAKKGLDPTEERALYTKVTKEQHNSVSLFFELKKNYKTFEDRENAVSFLLSSLGADKESKTPSIERAKLQDLISEIKALQGIIGVERFFKSRERLIDSMCAKI